MLLNHYIPLFLYRRLQVITPKTFLVHFHSQIVISLSKPPFVHPHSQIAILPLLFVIRKSYRHCISSFADRHIAAFNSAFTNRHIFPLVTSLIISLLVIYLPRLIINSSLSFVNLQLVDAHLSTFDSFVNLQLRQTRRRSFVNLRLIYIHSSTFNFNTRSSTSDSSTLIHQRSFINLRLFDTHSSTFDLSNIHSSTFDSSISIHQPSIHQPSTHRPLACQPSRRQPSIHQNLCLLTIRQLSTH